MRFLKTSDGRYDTKNIDTTVTILSKASTDTTSPVLRYQYHHVIYKINKNDFLKHYKTFLHSNKKFKFLILRYMM